MGLGLFLVETLVQELGGTLKLDTELGRGTRVEVIVPTRTPQR